MRIKHNEEVAAALSGGMPVVALESTVIAHGLPYPRNLETAVRLEEIIRQTGAIPATIAIFRGDFCVGLTAAQIEHLATDKTIRKVSMRDLPIAAAASLDCATTVATTAHIAHRSGIRVFATGGIGGVHRGGQMDVSADLPELARTPITVVCSGAKIVLDLPATREWLETFGVTVLGWKCEELPAFYSRESGLKVDQRVDSAREAAAVAAARDDLDLACSVLVTVPVPDAYEIPRNELESILSDSLGSAEKSGVGGKDLTPFLLSEMSRISEGRTLEANIALLESNARVAAEIAIALKQEQVN
jgi:pseudouridine-5'-phosphate glycosidase